MKIYFAIPMISGKSPAVPYKEIRDFLVENGHQVLTEHLLEEGAWESESQLPREFIFQRDISWLKEADLMIAEVSVPSLGIGFEIAYALGLKKEVLCLALDGVRVSAMIEGNRNLTLIRYRDSQEALRAVRAFLEAIRARR
ncbi:MAG: nucleoside 2-deoxyribosyltransferase [Caldiserica bacterium]|jgi:nucleoside 2-deoxyribosyltransferase|nr:nucleoside 2-deoxyribosyltransferase [Caldisericota bacterium]